MICKCHRCHRVIYNFPQVKTQSPVEDEPVGLDVGLHVWRTGSVVRQWVESAEEVARIKGVAGVANKLNNIR